jgi:hypothetical protein
MLDHIFTSLDGWTVLKIAAALIPAIMFVWILATVTALHNRDVYFWGLGSTWATVIGSPTGLIIASLVAWSQLNDPNAAPLHACLGRGRALCGRLRLLAPLQLRRHQIGAAGPQHEHAAADRFPRGDLVVPAIHSAVTTPP